MLCITNQILCALFILPATGDALRRARYIRFREKPRTNAFNVHISKPENEFSDLVNKTSAYLGRNLQVIRKRRLKPETFLFECIQRRVLTLFRGRI